MTDGANGMSILITGLGGQGVMLASRAIALTATRKFPFVSRTESRGLSQRGGSVVSEVRFGYRESSTAIGIGQADLVLALDCMEALRCSERVKVGGIILTNSTCNLPAYLAEDTAAAVGKNYTGQGFQKLVKQLNASTQCIHALDLERIASGVGYVKGLNVALMGAASLLLPFRSELLLEVAVALVPEAAKSGAHTVFWQGRRVFESATKSQSALTAA